MIDTSKMGQKYSAKTPSSEESKDELEEELADDALTESEDETKSSGPLTDSKQSETYGKKSRKGKKWQRDNRAASQAKKNAPPTNTKEVCR